MDGESMTKTEKIRRVVKEYKNLLKCTNMDVCESVKGRWYFMQYDEEFEEYESIREFETAEELIDMFTRELALYMNLEIGNEPELPVHAHTNIADAFCDDEIDCEEAIIELNQSLNMILSSDNADEKVAEFIKTMQKLLTK